MRSLRLAARRDRPYGFDVADSRADIPVVDVGRRIAMAGYQPELLAHFQNTLMICKRTRPVLVLHERRSRLTIASKLTGKSAAEAVAVMMNIFKRLSPKLRNSITFDNGTEFARHSLLASVTDMTTWFCDAYASWQKGSIENTTGRLRRHLPRDLDIDAMSQSELQDIVMSHNLTPRKCLGYITPVQAFLKDLGKDVRIRFA